MSNDLNTVISAIKTTTSSLFLFIYKRGPILYSLAFYILIQLLKWDEEFVFHKFLKDGLVIRKCSSFDGLGENHIRVAIKDRDKNSRLIESFKKLERI